LRERPIAPTTSPTKSVEACGNPMPDPGCSVGAVRRFVRAAGSTLQETRRPALKITLAFGVYPLAFLDMNGSPRLQLQTNRLAKVSLLVPAFVMACLTFVSRPAQACTIFVLTDTNRALFCNNEDWSDTKTRIWFLPAGDGYYGAVYVGFDNGYAQGGLNTEGLAFDWVAGYREQWKPDPHLPVARGNSSQRMLETCVTVNDAIAFYRSHNESGFWRAKILVADRTGASVIIGARDGQLTVEPDNQCRGFGFGHQTLDAALAKHPEPTVAEGFKILRDCRQSGDYATKYSNIYDLKSGDIFLYPSPGHDDEVTLNLATELKKGAHYYEMPKIKEQLTQAPLPLPVNMKRFPIDECKPIPDREPEVTAHLRAMIGDAARGNSRTDEYAAELWKEISPKQKQIQTDITKRLGGFTSMTLVDRSDEKGQHSYRYRLEFTNATVLQHFVFDGQNKLAASKSEAFEWKPGAEPPDVSNTPVVGIGVALRVDGSNIIVQEIVPGSPAAAQQNIHAGDRIIAVTQDTGPAVPVHGGKAAQAIDLIRGPAGTTVRLTLVSAGEDDSHARVVSFVRAELKLPLH